MKKLKFIHAADLHLGTPLENSHNLPTRLAKIVQNATYKAFERICDLATHYQVDFVLLSGDVFDQKARSIKAEDFLEKQIEKLKEHDILLFLIAGNHDPIRETDISKFDTYDNVKYFGSEEVEENIIRLDKTSVRILGQSYRSRVEPRKMVNYFTPVDDDSFNVGMLHTQLDANDKSYVPCSLGDLKNKKGIDYWALGHIHKFEILSREQPAIVFPGTPQGRHVGENGPKGCVLVTVENNKISDISFLPTSPVIWLEKEVSIEKEYNKTDNSNEHEKFIMAPPENIRELRDFLGAKGEKILRENTTDDDNNYNYIEGYMVRWVITGKTSLHEDLLEQEDEVHEVLIENLRRKLENQTPFIWSESIQFRTAKPLPPIEDLKKYSDVFKYIDELTKKCQTDLEFQKRIIKEFGDVWEWQDDHEDYNERKLQLDEETFFLLIEKAKELAVEKLLERREED